MYKLIMNPLTNTVSAVCKTDVQLFIPVDPANTDYQEYLRWLEAGNTPIPAEEAQ